jgi:hypothetical protein
MERRIMQICASCSAPLIRFRASRALRLYRILPTADLIRITGLFVSIAAILFTVAFPGGGEAMRLSVDPKPERAGQSHDWQPD